METRTRNFFFCFFYWVDRDYQWELGTLDSEEKGKEDDKLVAEEEKNSKKTYICKKIIIMLMLWTLFFSLTLSTCPSAHNNNFIHKHISSSSLNTTKTSFFPPKSITFKCPKHVISLFNQKYFSRCKSCFDKDFVFSFCYQLLMRLIVV